MAVKYGVHPKVFTRLIRQESGFNPHARSGAGAIGLTQLMPATAKALAVNPSDPVDNLRGGAKYLGSLIRRHGGCKEGAAAYNGGPGAVPYLKRTGWRYDPTAPRHAWSNQTAEYVMKVCEGV